MQSLQSKGFGGSTKFSDKELQKVLKTHAFDNIDEAERFLIQTTPSKGLIGTSCDPSVWQNVFNNLLKFLKAINTTDIEYYKSKPFIHEMLDSQDTLIRSFHISVLSASGVLIPFYADSVKFNATLREREHLLQLWEKDANSYDSQMLCNDEFPRMSCEKLDTDSVLGRCRCSKISKLFNYNNVDGQCVGEEGVVCTSVRGSSHYSCARGLRCDYMLAPSTIGIPNPLTHLEIKVCQKPLTTKIRTTSTAEPTTSGQSEMVFNCNCSCIALLLTFTITNVFQMSQ